MIRGIPERWAFDAQRNPENTMSIERVVPSVSHSKALWSPLALGRDEFLACLLVAVGLGLVIAMAGPFGLTGWLGLGAWSAASVFGPLALWQLCARKHQVAVVFGRQHLAVMARPLFFASRRTWPQFVGANAAARLSQSAGCTRLGVRSANTVHPGQWLDLGPLSDDQRTYINRWTRRFAHTRPSDRELTGSISP
jgi:hypothetical protein